MIKFRLMVDKTHYVTVCIAHTEQQMKKIGKELIRGAGRLKGSRGDYFARAHLYSIGEEVAFVLFCRKWVGAGIVSHEMLHVVRGWMDRKGLSFEANEEKACVFLENLVSSFWTGWYKANDG